MAVDLKEKLKGFMVPVGKFGEAKPATGIMLPQAFLATTKVRKAVIPEGAEAVAERTALGDFRLTWWDAEDRCFSQVYTVAEIDIDGVLQQAVSEMLASVTTEQLETEVNRRRLADELREKNDGKN